MSSTRQLKELTGADANLLITSRDIQRDLIFNRLNTLNMLEHYLLSQRDSVVEDIGKEAFGKLEKALRSTIETAEMFHSFMVENRMALDEVKSNTKALIFGRLSDAAYVFEEYLTKEDPIRDVLIQTVPFFLSAVSEKSYIDNARIGHKGILRSHSLYLYSAIYGYLKSSKKVSATKEAEEVALMMKKLYDILDSVVEMGKGLPLFIGLYLVVYKGLCRNIVNKNLDIVNHIKM